MYCPGCHKKLDTSLTSCDRCGWQIALGQCIPRAEHDRIVAEKDAEIVRLREALRKIADADRLPTPSYGGVPGQYDYLPRSGRFGMMARAALVDDNEE